MNAQTDQQLLRSYAEEYSEPAFAELVSRHVDLVYSAALRMVCDSHQAEDVTQAVFVALSQSARQLTSHPVLSGWLHRTTQNLAANSVRANVRRKMREQEAVVMNELSSHDSDATWEHIAPQLDAALGELNEADRDAVLLRYFEKKSAQEMAEHLGISTEAAQKRVSRAVDRLRELFAKRGVTVGAGGFAVVISAHAVQAAPVGLALTISTAAPRVGTTIATATKAIAMTTIQKAMIVATLAIAAIIVFLMTQDRHLLGYLMHHEGTELERPQPAKLPSNTDTCLNNLRWINAAIEQYALENRQRIGTQVSSEQILPYLGPNDLPTCPSGGTYTLGVVGGQPSSSCSITGHSLQ